MPEHTGAAPLICSRCHSVHITLRCRNHPEKRWATKNIHGRTVWYNTMPHDPSMGPECNCPSDDLYHDHERDGDKGAAGPPPSYGSNSYIPGLATLLGSLLC